MSKRRITRRSRKRDVASPRRVLWRAGLVVGIAGVCAVAVLVTRGHATRHESPADVVRIAPPAAPVAPPLPVDAGPSTPVASYIGSERCSDCHDKEFAGWK